MVQDFVHPQYVMTMSIPTPKVHFWALLIRQMIISALLFWEDEKEDNPNSNHNGRGAIIFLHPLWVRELSGHMAIGGGHIFSTSSLG